MNNIRMILCGLVVIVIASVGIINASYVDGINKNSKGYGWQEALCIILPSIISSQMDQKRDFVNALIDVSGSAGAYYYNQYPEIYEKSIGNQVLHMTPTFLFDLPVNYSIRKGSKYLNGKGITVEALANKCDVLPEGIVRDIVNPVVKCSANIVTQPQAMTVLLVWAGKSLLSMYGILKE